MELTLYVILEQIYYSFIRWHWWWVPRKVIIAEVRDACLLYCCR